MLLNRYCINLLVFTVQGATTTPLIPHTAPNPSEGKLQTTQINVDVFLYSATTMDYKTAEGVNREVMQLHYSSFMYNIDFVFLLLRTF